MTSPDTLSLSDRSLARFDLLTEVIASAGTMALDFFARRGELTPENKSPTDFVSEADRAVERCIRSTITGHLPDDLVVGEELGGRAGAAYWLVDPIDGTSNFLSGLPLWSISVAYVENGHPTFGAVSIPLMGRSLLGGGGIGLHEIGRTGIERSARSRVFGIGRNEHWPPDRRTRIEDLLAAQGLTGLCLGSCATSLALVASGELAGYAEGNVGFWDIAAGVALCEAVGVPVSFAPGDGPNSAFVAAGPSAIQSQIFDITEASRR